MRADVLKPAPYFPGQDFPDREVWLARRHTDRHAPRGTLIYTAVKGGKPLRLGINLAKRIEERILGRRGARFIKRGGGGVVQARHRYYTEN
jgi:hypothetical protein